LYTMFVDISSTCIWLKSSPVGKLVWLLIKKFPFCRVYFIVQT
jgi:hypothetical protein